jgi:membrane-associated phospholipid phosphatase
MLNSLAVALVLQAHASVYHVKPKLDVPVMLAGAAALIIPYAYADRLITPRCPCDPRGVNAFDRPAIGNHSAIAKSLSDVTVATVLVAPLAIDMLALGRSRPWLDDAVVFGQTLVVNGALVTAAKFIVQRPLPRTYAGDPNMMAKPEGYRSFYSGHTSLVFAGLAATAMTIRLRYGEKTWPWVIMGVLGSSVAVERVADGRHFPSDVIVGALMGTAVGVAVPLLHRKGFVAPAPGGLALSFGT